MSRVQLNEILLYEAGLILSVVCVVFGVSISLSSSIMNPPYSEDVLFITVGRDFYQVCSSIWNHPKWSDFVCRQLGHGESIGYVTKVPNATERGYLHAENSDYDPMNSILEILKHTANCTTGMVVAIQCAFNECGQNKLLKSQSSPVIGGLDAPVGKWPWMVTVTNYIDFCGGSVLTREWIVTAAHCVINEINPKKYLLTMGTANLSDLTVHSLQQRGGSKIIIHPNYKKDEHHDDIALIHLDRPIDFTYYVRPVCIPFQAMVTPLNRHTECYVMGFGETQQFSQIPDVSTILQEALVDVVSDERCGDIFSAGLPFDPVKMVCAGDPFGDPGVCTGDSGGPLVCNIYTDYWLLVGLTSWGIRGCARYGVFTEVSTYTNWMSQHVNSLPVKNSASSPHGNTVVSYYCLVVIICFCYCSP